MNIEPYRRAETQLWAETGVAPTEHRIHLGRSDVTVRAQTLGDGPPVLFIHGGPGANGSIWAHLAGQLPDFSCILIDRPGTGLSDAKPMVDPAAVIRESETLVVDVLDALDLPAAHLVGSSHGSHVALLSALAHPDRVMGTVHLGCPGFIEGMTLTATDRLILLPGVRQLFSRVRPSEKALRKTLRQLGHGVGLDREVFSPAMLEWFVSVQRDTDTMRNELQSMSAMGTFRRGFDPSLTITTEMLSGVRSPTYFLWGTDDAYGDAGTARAAADAMPAAELELLPGAGHLCWFDDLDRAVTAVRRHLTNQSVQYDTKEQRS